jgi:AraC-like DNA-binding protein
MLMEIFSIYLSYNCNGNQIPFLQRQALINNLLLKLTQTYRLVPATEIKENHTIIEILKFLNQNYKEELSLPITAKQFHYSPKYFSELFKQNVGCNFTEYLHNIRIKNILSQLEDPDNKQSITSLALENGFNSLATFYRVLKQYNQQPTKKNK